MQTPVAPVMAKIFSAAFEKNSATTMAAARSPSVSRVWRTEGAESNESREAHTYIILRREIQEHCWYNVQSPSSSGQTNHSNGIVTRRAGNTVRQFREVIITPGEICARGCKLREGGPEDMKDWRNRHLQRVNDEKSGTRN